MDLKYLFDLIVIDNLDEFAQKIKLLDSTIPELASSRDKHGNTLLQAFIDAIKIDRTIEYYEKVEKCIALLIEKGAEVNAKPMPLLQQIFKKVSKFKYKEQKKLFLDELFNNPVISTKVDFSVEDKKNKLVFDYLDDDGIRWLFPFFQKHKIIFPVEHYRKKSTRPTTFLAMLSIQNDFYQHRYAYGVLLDVELSNTITIHNLLRDVQSALIKSKLYMNEDSESANVPLEVVRNLYSMGYLLNNPLESYQEYKKIDNGSLWMSLENKPKLNDVPENFDIRFDPVLNAYFAVSCPIKKEKTMDHLIQIINDSNSKIKKRCYEKLVTPIVLRLLKDNKINKEDFELLKKVELKLFDFSYMPHLFVAYCFYKNLHTFGVSTQIRKMAPANLAPAINFFNKVKKSKCINKQLSNIKQSDLLYFFDLIGSDQYVIKREYGESILNLFNYLMYNLLIDVKDKLIEVDYFSSYQDVPNNWYQIFETLMQSNIYLHPKQEAVFLLPEYGMQAPSISSVDESANTPMPTAIPKIYPQIINNEIILPTLLEQIETELSSKKPKPDLIEFLPEEINLSTQGFFAENKIQQKFFDLNLNAINDIIIDFLKITPRFTKESLSEPSLQGFLSQRYYSEFALWVTLAFAMVETNQPKIAVFRF